MAKYICGCGTETDSDVCPYCNTILAGENVGKEQGPVKGSKKPEKPESK